MNHSKMTKRQIQAIQTKEHIFNSTMSLLKRYSYESITINDICKNANISVGTFYHYFDGKADVLEEGYRFINELFLNKLHSLDMSPLNKIYHAFKVFIDICNEFGYAYIAALIRYELFTNKSRENTPDKALFSYIYEQLNQISISKHLEVSDIDTIYSYLYRIFKGTLYEWIVKEGRFDLYSEFFKMSKIILSPYID